MYPGVEVMWLGKSFIASIKAIMAEQKQKYNDKRRLCLISGGGVKGSVSLN